MNQRGVSRTSRRVGRSGRVGQATATPYKSVEVMHRDLRSHVRESAIVRAVQC